MVGFATMWWLCGGSKRYNDWIGGQRCVTCLSFQCYKYLEYQATITSAMDIAERRVNTLEEERGNNEFIYR
mgnify:CR=1 FL=1